MGKVIPSNWELPQAISSRFGTQAGKQRAMVHEGHLVLVIHLVPKHDEVERRAVLFWRHPSGTWKGSGEAKGGLPALKGVVESYRQKLLELETASDNARRAADYFRVLQEVAPILRSSRHLHKTLQEAREAVSGDADIIALRDAAADVERLAELVQADSKAGLDFTVARRAEEQADAAEHIAKSSHRLNLIAALFLPVSAIGSVFGVNLAHGLENAGKPWLFWTFVGLSFAIGLIVRSSINKRELPAKK